mmetsp:Transcript_71021/g.184943  ORF Transcript_71021/g.184943 Transcript_71021/m.184943 type:complete len:234 (+) Transcript_71021:61-762(+)
MAGGGGALRAFAGLAMIGVSVVLYVNFHHLLTIKSLRANHSAILATVAANPRLAPLCYIGGILFEQPYASGYAYCGYIVGATISFFVTTFILGDYMRKRLAEKSTLYTKFEANVKRNAFGYLVAARYTMVFPFFFVNAAAALVGVHWKTFIAATTVSCIPGSVIYTTAGGALANLLHKLGDEDKVDNSQLIWMALDDPNVRICIGGMSCALLVLLTVRQLTPQDEEIAEKKDT